MDLSGSCNKEKWLTWSQASSLWPEDCGSRLHAAKREWHSGESCKIHLLCFFMDAVCKRRPLWLEY